MGNNGYLYLSERGYFIGNSEMSEIMRNGY